MCGCVCVVWLLVDIAECEQRCVEEEQAAKNEEESAEASQPRPYLCSPIKQSINTQQLPSVECQRGWGWEWRERLCVLLTPVV